MTTDRRKSLLHIAFILSVTLIFFHQLALGEAILARGDTHDYFYPYWDVRNAAFRAGELPLWTNDLFMGTPLLANPQLGTYYPPNWLTAPFRAPAAISISILLHCALAAFGTCILYRQAISKRWIPALGAAVIYAFGGYLGAHVEQINQLQGLAWMPILFTLAHRLLTGGSPLRDGLLLALACALQIFSGHTQTVFISGIGLGVYGLSISAIQGGTTRWTWRVLRALILLAAAVLGALLLSLPQLLPSLELAALSNRGSGFSVQEATAFSLPPHALGRSMLPGYDGQLFGEYVAYIGVIGLGLALWGVFAGRFAGRRKWIWLLLAGLGLVLALGRFTPLYQQLAGLPGFNIFRVPARFLALYSLALAMLAGMGIEALEPPQKRIERLMPFVLLVAAALALLILMTGFVLVPDPGLIFGDSAISQNTMLLWCGAGVLVLGLLWVRQRWVPIAAVALVTIELFIAAQNLPYNDVAPADVYLNQRFSVSQLRALQADEVVPGRTLSISQLYFDPGDILALRARFERLGMDYAAQFHAFDAVKKGEVLSPNLGLTWGIPTIDGFGGGLMPMQSWTAFSELLLPAEEQLAVDGRLGARLALRECRGACIPERQWLEATDTRYLIVDKTNDVWHEGIAYDLALARFWGDVTAIAAPGEIYDQARVLHYGRGTNAIEVGNGMWLSITDIAGLGEILGKQADILAVTAVNSRHEQIFLELQPPPFERILSSSIKIYQDGRSSGRAYLPKRVTILPNERHFADILRQLATEGGTIIQGDAEAVVGALGSGGSVDVIEYDDRTIRLRVNSPEATYVILRDAFYPGWEAEVSGEAVPIYRANVVFRAVPVPAGESIVSFRFEPRLWRAALTIGGGAWLCAGAIWWWLRRRESALDYS